MCPNDDEDRHSSTDDDLAARLVDPKALFELGFFPGPDENQEQFKQRVELSLAWSQTLHQKDLCLESENITLSQQDRIAESTLISDGQACKNLYGICPSWVPAYTTNQGLPALTGGMAVQFWDEELEIPKTWFQLKSVYKERPKWLIYERSEIISHEMCHVARLHLGSTRYEETLAYGVSQSWLRKSIGGALLTPKDNLIFFVTLMAWIFVDFAQIINFKGSDMIWPLRIALPLTIVLGLIRNANIKKELRHAQKKLEVIYGHLASNVLFCLNDLQIKTLYRSEEIDINTIWPDPTSYQKNFITAFTKDVYKAPSSEKFQSPL